MKFIRSVSYNLPLEKFIALELFFLNTWYFKIIGNESLMKQVGFFQVHSVVEEMDGLDDVENSMLYYNQAVILYHLRQYTEAISVGEKLYQFIEPFGM